MAPAASRSEQFFYIEVACRALPRRRGVAGCWLLRLLRMYARLHTAGLVGLRRRDRGDKGEARDDSARPMHRCKVQIQARRRNGGAPIAYNTSIKAARRPSARPS